MQDNLPPLRASLENLSSSFPCTRLLDMPCEGDAILKHFLIKIERGYIHFFPFFCLQAVNYLTSTHNEQCKTSQNLIKRQWRGPSADGKWLTQLIKHRGVRLNMASQSWRKKKDGICCAILFSISSLVRGTFNTSIILTPQPLFFPQKGIYVCTPCCLSANFLSLMNHNAKNSEVASAETRRTTV